MFFQNYIQGLPEHKTDIQDRLAQDSSNDTLRTFLKLSVKILKDFYVNNNPALEERSRKLLLDLQNRPEEVKDNYHNLYPEFKEELEFYFDNKKDIDLLRTYIESSEKVKHVSKIFFKKDK